MKFHLKDFDALAVDFVYEDQGSDSQFFRGKPGEIGPAHGTIKLGLGKKEDFKISKLQEYVYGLGKYLGERELSEVTFPTNPFDIEDEEYILLVTEALKYASYKFDHYKKEKVDFNLTDVYFPAEYDSHGDMLCELLTVLDAVSDARDLVNLRANCVTPAFLAKRAEELLADTDVKVTVYDKDEIEEIGMTAFLEVAKGSDNEPKFITMEYNNGGDEKPLLLVGKGLTYDSGGYSLKPSNSMDTMHSDMAGSATVIATMKAIGEAKLDVNVVAVVAACENLIDGGAYKPGDIVKSMKGTTIEVGNTDAEGRVTLADSIYYGVTKYDPEMVVDIATLTGAILVAFAETYTGAVASDDETYEKLSQAAIAGREKVWQLPTDDVYRDAIKSKVADISNTGARGAGSITAGLFLQHFTEDKPWVHLDIAGTSFLSKKQGILEEGATGVHVKTLYNLAKTYNN